MEQFISTVEMVIVWFLFLGGILLGWLAWIIHRQKVNRARELEFGADGFDPLPDGDGLALDRKD